jgi:hypothetical protein
MYIDCQQNILQTEELKAILFFIKKSTLTMQYYKFIMS